MIAEVFPRLVQFTALHLERSLDLVVSILAILKAGAAYVPLDTKHPAARLAYISENARLPLILALSRFVPLLEGCHVPVICLDEERPNISRQSGEDLQAIGSADSLAYIIYTSGTTGTPKGV